MPSKTHASRLLDQVRTHGTVRPRDLEHLGIPRQVLKRLHDRGELVRRSRGVYSLPDYELTRHTDLATVCARSRNDTRISGRFQIVVRMNRSGCRAGR